MSDVPALLIYALYRLDAKDVETYKELSARMAAEAGSHDGCLFLDVLQDPTDQTVFRLVESWKSQEALDKHLASDFFKGIMKEAKNLTITENYSDVYSVAGKKPLDMSASQ